MKSLLIIFSLFLFGCTSTVPISQPIVSCAKDLRPSDLEPCSNPGNLPVGATFEQGLFLLGEYKSALKKCSEKTQLLQQIAKACNSIR